MELDEPQRHIILNETDNLTQYWWFNDVCVYESETFFEFFNWMQSHNKFSSMMSGRHYFDYFLYSMWLMVFKGFKIKKLCKDIFFNWAAMEESMDITIINEFKSLISKLPECEYTKVIIHKAR